MTGATLYIVVGFAAVLRCLQWCRRDDVIRAAPWLVIAIFLAAAAW